MALRGRMNRGADAGIGGAAADVAAHRGIDVGIGRRGILFQQRRRRHDLSGLAVAALRDLQFDPGRLHRLGLLALQALDGRDLRDRPPRTAA